MASIEISELPTRQVEQTFTDSVSVTFGNPSGCNSITAVTADLSIPKISIAISESSITLSGYYTIDLFGRPKIEYVDKDSSTQITDSAISGRFEEVPANKDIISYIAPKVNSKLVTYTVSVLEDGSPSSLTFTQYAQMNYTPGRNALVRYVNASGS